MRSEKKCISFSTHSINYLFSPYWVHVSNLVPFPCNDSAAQETSGCRVGTSFYAKWSSMMKGVTMDIPLLVIQERDAAQSQTEGQTMYVYADKLYEQGDGGGYEGMSN